MTTKLTRHGEQWAVILDDSLLASLSVGPETPLEVTTDGHSVSIKPAVGGDAPSFEEGLEAVNNRHGGALRKLAEWLHIADEFPLQRSPRASPIEKPVAS